MTQKNKKGFFPMLLSNGDCFHVHLGDCITHMAEMPCNSVDMSVFSPPFPSLYAYTSETGDIGNSEDFKGEAQLHLSFFYRQLARIVKPGRVVAVHVAQIPRMKRTGGVGLYDFRGLNIRLGERAGLVFEYDWLIPKNPQAQAIRTKSRELQFCGLETDRAKQRGCIPDYIIKFRAPGDNAVKINGKGEVSRQEWIDWAEAAWYGIRETNTLNVVEGRDKDDTKHICPLQLDVIDRLVRLFSDPGDIVFSPFTGIGSEGYMSLLRFRRFYGCELKKSYHEAAVRNLGRALGARNESQTNLFTTANADENSDCQEVPS